MKLADRFGIAPYIIQSITQEEAAAFTTDEAFFRWAFAWPVRRSCDSNGAMFQNAALSRQHGIELSIYEINHHITHGDGPLEPRNKLVTSIGGGLNVLGNMLLMLKEHHLRAQFTDPRSDLPGDELWIGPRQRHRVIVIRRPRHPRVAEPQDVNPGEPQHLGSTAQLLLAASRQVHAFLKVIEVSNASFAPRGTDQMDRHPFLGVAGQRPSRPKTLIVWVCEDGQ